MPPGTTINVSRTTTLIASIAVAILAAGAGLAFAGKGGGLSAPDKPRVTDVRCLERCLDVRSVAEGGVVELVGKDLGAVSEVRVRGAGRTTPEQVRNRSVTFEVPKGAGSGKPTAFDAYGNRDRAPKRLDVKPANAVEDTGEFSVRSAEATRAKAFYKSKRKSKINYLFEADSATDVRVDVLKGKRGRLVDSIVKRDQEPFVNQKVRWNGLTDEGDVAPNGRYHFEVKPLSGGETGAAPFRYYDHFFPLRGKHGYGDGLGAGRGHQGQDVFAPCGTKIKAARGGKVQVSAYHSAAGYYVVVDGAKTGQDYVYMHMQQRGRPDVGDRIKTGEKVGIESDTGRATGCHLHFELWSAPGWYEGGSPVDPTTPLKRWDRWS